MPPPHSILCFLPGPGPDKACASHNKMTPKTAGSCQELKKPWNTPGFHGAVRKWAQCPCARTVQVQVPGNDEDHAGSGEAAACMISSFLRSGARSDLSEPRWASLPCLLTPGRSFLSKPQGGGTGFFEQSPACSLTFLTNRLQSPANNRISGSVAAGPRRRVWMHTPHRRGYEVEVPPVREC